MENNVRHLSVQFNPKLIDIIFENITFTAPDGPFNTSKMSFITLPSIIAAPKTVIRTSSS